MNVFADYSKFYDLLYSDKNYPKEAAYILKLIKKHKPGSKTVLEFGCGTGIHASILAKAKLNITGIDQSKTMIESAIKRLSKLPKNTSKLLNFQVGDIRNKNLHNTYDVCLSLFHIISYQTSNADVINTFTNARKHLKPGGLFVFDCWYGPAVLGIMPSVKEKNVENDQVKIIRIATPEVHLNKCIVDVNYHLLIIDKKNSKCEELREKHEMRYFFKPELEYFLSTAGFELTHTEEWITQNTPGSDTWGVTFIAKAI